MLSVQLRSAKEVEVGPKHNVVLEMILGVLSSIPQIGCPPTKNHKTGLSLKGLAILLLLHLILILLT